MYNSAQFTEKPHSIHHPVPFPPEIISLFVDAVAQAQDESTLRACHLVSSSFARRAKAHLFDCVKLSLTWDDPIDVLHRKLRRLENLTRVPQSIIPYKTVNKLIRVVEFDLFDFEGDHEVEAAVFNDPILSRVLDSFHGPSHGIKEFDLRAPIGFQSWEDISPGFQGALRRLICSPGLLRIALTSIPNLPPDIFNTPNLTSFEVSFASEPSFEDNIDTNHSSVTVQLEGRIHALPTLESIRTDHSLMPFRLEDGRYDGSPYVRLKHFYSDLVSCPKTASNQTNQILRLNDGSLEHLDLVGIDLTGEDLRPIDLGHLQRLITIYLSPSPTSLGVSTEDNLRDICHLLNGPGAAISLRTCTLNIPIASTTGEGVVPSLPQWLELDSLLASSKFPRLERVELQLYMDFHYSTQTREQQCNAESGENVMRALMPSILPRMLARDLVVDLTVDRPNPSDLSD